MQAIRKTVEALRGIARWGTSEMMAAAFTGFKALPKQASASSGATWWQVLGVQPDATPYEIRKAHQAGARLVHPDLPGGSEEAMSRLNQARDRGLYENQRP